MWLLNTSTLKLHEFLGAHKPEYGILSHRWTEGEIVFKDVMKLRNLDAPGWTKVRQCCLLARETFGREWVWIDTCCINKSSSAELSEAINSMFRWYAEAEECYAYLNDRCGSGPTELMSSFYKSKWFTRGWTLQELLAPRQVYFIESDWKTIFGTRSMSPDFHAPPIYLRDQISQITGINAETLDTPFTGKSHDLPDGRFKPAPSYAQRMFWASGRQCTREEDMSYCLLGLFGVNMVLLYGEGVEKALSRLQEEISKAPDEDSTTVIQRLMSLFKSKSREHKL